MEAHNFITLASETGTEPVHQLIQMLCEEAKDSGMEILKE